MAACETIDASCDLEIADCGGLLPSGSELDLPPAPNNQGGSDGRGKEDGMMVGAAALHL
jgi:hypothetical protein